MYAAGYRSAVCDRIISPPACLPSPGSARVSCPHRRGAETTQTRRAPSYKCHSSHQGPPRHPQVSELLRAAQTRDLRLRNASEGRPHSICEQAGLH